MVALAVYVKSRAKVPGGPCGDAFWYAEEQGRVWVLVVDGLGSGQEAAAASGAAVHQVRNRVARLRARATALEAVVFLQDTLEKCDQALRHTRGAALGLALLDAAARQGHYAGVGNIDLRVIGGSRFHTMTTPGIVGAGLRKVRVEPFSYTPGDLVLMHSDGLSSRFDLDSKLAASWHLEALGEKLVKEHGYKHDDLTVVLLRQYV